MNIKVQTHYGDPVLGLRIMIFIKLMGENILRCTTQDEKGLVLIALFFYPIF
jgi:hypothetical protein